MSKIEHLRVRHAWRLASPAPDSLRAGARHFECWRITYPSSSSAPTSRRADHGRNFIAGKRLAFAKIHVTDFRGARKFGRVDIGQRGRFAMAPLPARGMPGALAR
jgi:hypothetical protein